MGSSESEHPNPSPSEKLVSNRIALFDGEADDRQSICGYVRTGKRFTAATALRPATPRPPHVTPTSSSVHIHIADLRLASWQDPQSQLQHTAKPRFMDPGTSCSKMYIRTKENPVAHVIIVLPAGAPLASSTDSCRPGKPCQSRLEPDRALMFVHMYSASIATSAELGSRMIAIRFHYPPSDDERCLIAQTSFSHFSRLPRGERWNDP